MQTRTKIITLLLAIIAPFVALKLMGRPLVVETKVTLKAEKENGLCIPLTTTSLIDRPQYIVDPSMGFALSRDGVLQQMGRLDLVFNDHPKGRVELAPNGSVKTCIYFRSDHKLKEFRRKFSTRNPAFLLQCKLGVMMGEPGQNFTRVYALVFPCERYLKGFEVRPTP